MSRQSRHQKRNIFFRHEDRDSRHRKDIHHDRSDNVSHMACYLQQWRSLLYVIGTIRFFFRLTHNNGFNMGQPKKYTYCANNIE